MKAVTIYSTQTCPYCTMMKDWLNRHNVKFSEIDVAKDKSAAKRMVEESGQVGVPVLMIAENSDKRFIIGYDTDALNREFCS